MKTLIVYYSYSGNTKKIAKLICENIGGDIEEIEPTDPYEGDYDAVVDQGKDEVEKGYMPVIKPLSADLSQYDTIILGTPVWWYTFAPAVKSFLEENDLSGKKIYPFVTNGGWIGHTVKDIEKACPESDVCRGINIKFNGDKLATSESEIKKWILSIK